MKKVKLGNTDLKVSQMGLGCLYFGARDSKEKSFRRMDQHLAAGGNFLDTANMYSPLLQGAYTNPKKDFKEQYQGPDTDKRLAVLDEIAAETGATRNQLVYYWLMNRKPNAVPLIAATIDEQFEEAVGSLELDLSEKMIRSMTEAKF